ncbi:unnamed protein product [Dibothriocephalus latus]|uniref:Uncharacterized protein n=1 Tax=Dibothriocephalus latus TaxID=60516 RepID=A0A3P7M3F3_DIBLA|nr:unnamed protein product [Dibothriocephalus latus]
MPSGSNNLSTADSLKRITLASPRQHSTAMANNIFWSHAVGRQAAGGGKAGGTLSVAAGLGVAVSGGGDATCFFYFYDDDALSQGDWAFREYVCTTEHNAGVSAVAIRGELAVSGGKDGLLAFYQINAAVTKVSPVHREPLAHMDWITAIAMVERKLPEESETVTIVASGGNDHRVVIWSVSKDLTVKQLSVLTAHMSDVTHLTFKVLSCS